MNASIQKEGLRYKGDIACGHCNTVHITPPGMEVRKGELVCQVCNKKSIVTEELAQEANAIRAKLQDKL